MIATLLVAGGFGSRAKEEELTPIEDDDAPFVEETTIAARCRWDGSFMPR